MIIDCIGCLHGARPALEGGDLLIITGDLIDMYKKSIPELAKEYAVCKQTICNIINGITYLNHSIMNEKYEPVNKPVRIIL
jgi:hypothetical protein